MKTAKRSLMFLIIFMLSVFAVPQASFAALENPCGSCGDGLEWKIEGGTLYISGSGAMTDFSRSEEIGWFEYSSMITSAVIESGVTSVGNYAFYKCAALESVSVQQGCLSVGKGAFYGCSSLKSVELPDSVEKIGDMAFYNCTMLESVGLSSSLDEIGAGLFFGCSSLSEIRVSGSVEAIRNYAFFGCTSLRFIYLPSCVDEIDGARVFGRDGLLNDSIVGNVCFFTDGNSYADEYFAEKYITPTVVPDDAVAFGICGVSAWWAYNGSELSIEGSGKTDDIIGDSPWSTLNVESAVVGSHISGIGSGFFSGLDGLEMLFIPQTVSEISPNALDNSPKAVIYGFDGSAAQTLAEQSNHRFVSVGAEVNSVSIQPRRAFFADENEPFSSASFIASATITATIFEGEELEYETDISCDCDYSDNPSATSLFQSGLSASLSAAPKNFSLTVNYSGSDSDLSAYFGDGLETIIEVGFRCDTNLDGEVNTDDAALISVFEKADTKAKSYAALKKIPYVEPPISDVNDFAAKSLSDANGDDAINTDDAALASVFETKYTKRVAFNLLRQTTEDALAMYLYSYRAIGIIN